MLVTLLVSVQQSVSLHSVANQTCVTDIVNNPVVDVAGDAQCCVHTRRSHTQTLFI